MLQELHVRDLALIDESWLEFGPGMTVLTGETGAGKTALVGAIKLLVGERADSQMVRFGAEETLVEGTVCVSGSEMHVRRRVSADGRSRCTIDEEMATVGSLARRVGPLFDLHGQHEHQALLQSARHVEYLDRFVGPEATEALEAYRQALSDYESARLELREFDERLESDRDRAEYLRFVVEEIRRVGPSENEDSEIEARLPALRYADRLTEACSAAYAYVRGAEESAADLLARAQSALSKASGLDPELDALCSRLEDLSASSDEVGSALRVYGESIEHDPDALNGMEARRAALSELKKKYGPSLEEVLETARASEDRLALLDDGEQGRSELARKVEESRLILEHAASNLVKLRRAGVDRFNKALLRHTDELGMTGIRFDIGIEELEQEHWGPGGPVRVEFLFSPGADQPLRSLSKIASGGEISRVMLALKTVLGAADEVPVLVFDEVDAGIGGATALAVGRKLKSLASRHQVFVVTHLAQVAACADAHLVVRKEEDSDRVVTQVHPVSGQERVAEIARMLSGDDGAAGLAHAEELLGNASLASSELER